MYKQPPIWIINSTLVVLFICIIIFIALTRVKVPARTSINPGYPQETTPLKDVSKIDISRIYRNDLFHTYAYSPATEQKIEEKKLQLPPPPAPRPAAPIEVKPVQFLEPLAVTLKGVMHSSDEQFNRAVIQDNKSNKEKLYKVGDSVEDAEIIRIYYNKVMLIRSNGQQETLFISSKDAQKDPMYKQDITWSSIIQQTSQTEFMVHKEQFIQTVKNLAEFIDMLDITGAFKKGKNIGCRIGALKPQSLGFALGLQPNDIVLSVAEIPTVTTNDRVALFSKIQNMTDTDTIPVTVLRHGEQLQLTYSFAPPEQAQQSEELASNTLPEELQKMHDMSNKLVMESHTTKNPMVEHINKQTRQAMNNAPLSGTLLQHVPT